MVLNQYQCQMFNPIILLELWIFQYVSHHFIILHVIVLLKVDDVPSVSVPFGNSDTETIYSGVRTPYVSDAFYHHYSCCFQSCLFHIMKDINDGSLPQYAIDPSPIAIANTVDDERIPSEPFVGRVDVNVSW
jgi:hypothetical protein